MIAPTHRLRLRALLAELTQTIGALEATYWTISADGALLEATATAGPGADALEGLQVPAASSIVGLVAASGMPTSVGPDAEYHPAAAERTGIRTEAMAAAPVAVDGWPVGVVSAINPQRAPRFGSDDLDRLRACATRLAQLLGTEA